MQYLTSDIKWAAGVKDGRLLLNDLSRYRINIKPVNKVRGKNRYSLAALGHARIIGALQKLCIPMSHVNKMFDRICWDTYEMRVDQFAVRHIDHLIVVFLTFDPEFDDQFSGIITDPTGLNKIMNEFGNFTAVDVGDFFKFKLEGII
tara:strand:+ start:198 stop:638 length:441 start_codon:yes stop_codon:yes gene_type:complete